MASDPPPWVDFISTTPRLPLARASAIASMMSFKYGNRSPDHRPGHSVVPSFTCRWRSAHSDGDMGSGGRMAAVNAR